MDKEQIITIQSKEKLEQPKGSSVPALLLKEISVLSQIYQWNPTGYRVTLNLPIIGDDKSMLFYISASPYIPHISNDFFPFGLSAAQNIYANRCLVFHEMGDDLTSTESIIINQHSPPPLISDICRSNRYWTGSLRFRLRAIASFVNQGYLSATPFFGIKRQRFLTNPFITRQRFTRPDMSSFLGNQANSYTMSDASMSRHMEVEIDYRHATPMIDLLADLSSIVNFRVANDNNSFSIPPSSPYDETLIGVQLRGELPSNGTTNQMSYELEICAGENFRVQGEGVYFHPITRKQLEDTVSWYDEGGSQYRTLPISYLTPDFNTAGVSRWSGNVQESSLALGYSSLIYTNST